MPEQVALDGLVGFAEEMDRRHLRIDLELVQGGKEEILRRHRIGSRIGVAEQQLFAGGDHDIHGRRALMDHHFIIAVQAGGGRQHAGEALRIGIVSGIKKNCLIARQF